MSRRAETRRRRPFQADRDGELGNAVQEVGGAVERINDPAVRRVDAFDRAAFFHQKAVFGPRALQFLEQDGLGLAVGGRDEIGRALLRDLQMLDLAKVAAQARSRLARGALHDGDKGGM